MNQLDELTPKLEITLSSGCSLPTLQPLYNRHYRIQLPQSLTEQEKAELEVRLNLLPCNVKYVTGFRGKGTEMLVYEEYQGG